MTVTVPARLHLGFLDLNGGLGRRFGSIGLAITGMQTRIRIAAAEEMQVEGPERDRARRYLDRLRELLALDGRWRVEIADAIPGHAGLGSGTQLALALAAGVRRLHGLPLDVRADAARLGRGKRSGIGVGLFEQGGLVVDGGHGVATEVAPIITRMAFPEAWRVLLVVDRTRTGAHGDQESAAFARLPPFAATDSARLCRMLVMQVLPALAEADLVAFAAGIKDMQSVLGAYFAPLQGGRPLLSPDVAATLVLLEREGALGGGQSSWGPTGFAFAASPDAAARLVEIARRHPLCARLDIRACQGRNRGADITSEAAAANDR